MSSVCDGQLYCAVNVLTRSAMNELVSTQPALPTCLPGE